LVPVTIRIDVPPATSSLKRRPAYLSQGTQSITISVNGGTPVAQNLTPAGGNCSTPSFGATPVCTLITSAPVGTDTFTFVTYDQTNGAGNKLSQNTVMQQIVAGQLNTVSVTLEGIPVTVLIAALPNQSNVTQQSATTYTITGTTPAYFLVEALDADADVIVGVGTPTLAVTSNSSSLSVTTVASNPNEFVLTASAGSTTATVSALATGVDGGTANAAAGFTLQLTGPGSSIEFPLTAPSNPWGITAGPDGNLWFAEEIGNKVGKITTSGTVTTYPLSTGSSPLGITTGPDGNLWVAENGSSNIAKVTTSGTVTEYAVLNRPSAVTAGPDGNIWFAGGGEVGSVTTTGRTNLISIDFGHGYAAGITSGPDGNLWFTVLNTSTNPVTGEIGKINTAGTSETEYTLPAGSNPSGIAAGPDGNLWFTDGGLNEIGKITTSGVFTYYPITGSEPQGIVTGPNGNLWFTAEGSSQIGQITTAGVVTLYPTVTPSAFPVGITSGPDGNIWFTEWSTEGKIGKLLP
jgi:streptogramin lyase